VSGLAATITRKNLRSRTLEVLSRGGWGNPDVLLVRGAEGPVVVKDFAPRSALVRLCFGRWLTRREQRAYRALEGHPAVPRLLAPVDALAFTLEYRPGELLSRSLAGRVPTAFLDELREAVVAMHRRGVVHLDLRHRSNLLAGEDGHPVILDFASALCFRPGGWLARWLIPWVARIDLGALRKWEARLANQPSEPAPADAAAGTSSAGSRGESRPM
jgi:hypothetical protein